MIRQIGIALGILVFSAAPVPAQNGNPAPAAQDTQAERVIGATGTMYDGNNADLQLPYEQNAYWARLWSEPEAANNAAVAGTGTAATPGAGQTGDNP